MPKLQKKYYKLNIQDRINDNVCDLSLSELNKVPVHKINQFKRVTILDLSSNKLTTLGTNFVMLNTLAKIDLSKNQIVELPENFGDLHNLRHLDLYDNKLEHLPLSFGQLTNLRYLDLKGNPLLPALAKIVGYCLTTDECQLSARNTVKFFQQMNVDLASSKDQEPEIQTENSESTTNNDDKVSSNDQLAKISKKSKSRKKKAPKNSDNNNETYPEPFEITLITTVSNSQGLDDVDPTKCIRIYKPENEDEESDDFDGDDDDNSDRMQQMPPMLVAGTSQRASKKKRSAVRAAPVAIRAAAPKRSTRRQAQRNDDDVLDPNTAALSSILLFFVLLAVNVAVIYVVMFKNPEMAEWLVEYIPPQYRNWIVTKMELFRLRVGDLISEFRTPPEEH